MTSREVAHEGFGTFSPGPLAALGAVAAIATVIADHCRGDWSDRTYNCQGCRQRWEDAETARLNALGREPTRQERIDSHQAYNKVSHPEWTIVEYNAHVAQHVAARLFGSRDGQ